MRDITQREEDLIKSGEYDVAIRVEVEDEDGDFRDLTDLDGKDWVENVRIESNIDTDAISFTVEATRDRFKKSLALLMTNSKFNTDDNGDYSPLIEVSREIKIYYAIYNEETDPLDEDYFKEYIRGEINDIKWDQSPIPINCKDKVMNTLDYTFIEEEMKIGLDEDGEPIEDGVPIEEAMQTIMDEWDTGYELYVPEDPESNTEPYEIDKQSVRKAIEELYMGIGWQVRPRYVDGDLRPALLPIERDKEDIDWTFENYGVIQNYEKDNRSVRNRIKVVYEDPDGDKHHVVVEDEDSQKEHDVRFMEIQEGTFSQIYDEDKAIDLGNYALADLSDPYIQKRVDVGFFPYVHIGDHYEFVADYIHTDVDQDFIVEGFTIEVSSEKWITTLDLRGQAAVKYEGWLDREARDGVGDSNREREPEHVKNLTLISGYSTSQSDTHQAYLKAEWDRVRYSKMVKYHVFLREEIPEDEINDYEDDEYVEEGGTYWTIWDRVAVTESEKHREDNIDLGTYQVRVVAEHENGSQGEFSEAPSVEETVEGKTYVPDPIDFIDYYYANNRVYLKWETHPDGDVNKYELRTDDNYGVGDDNQLFRGDGTEYTINNPREMSYDFYLYAIDNTGTYSDVTELSLYNRGIREIDLNDDHINISEDNIEVLLPTAYGRYDTETGDTLDEDTENIVSVLGYVIRANNLEGGYDDKERTVSASTGEVNEGYTVEIPIPKTSSWGVKVGAFNSAVHPDHNDSEFEDTFSQEKTYDRPDTPTGLDLSTSIDKDIMPEVDTDSIKIMKDPENNVRIKWDNVDHEDFVEYEIEIDTEDTFDSSDYTVFYQDSNSLVLNNVFGGDTGADQDIYVKINVIGRSHLVSTFSFDAISEAEEYEIIYNKEDSENKEQIITENNSIDLDLDFEEDYKFKVRSIDENDWYSPYTDTQTHYTEDYEQAKSESDTVTVSIPDLLDVSATRDALQNFDTLLNSDFYDEEEDEWYFPPEDDEDFVYTGENIAAGTIQTQAISVGSKLRPFSLEGITFDPNFNGRGSIEWTSGYLIRITEGDEQTDTWSVPSGDFLDLDEDELYYIYIRCPKDDTEGSMEYSTSQPTFDDGDYYNFNIGTLDTDSDLDADYLATSYGFTFIDGSELTTGTINASNVNVIGGGGGVQLTGYGLTGGYAEDGEITEQTFELASDGNFFVGNPNSTRIEWDNENEQLRAVGKFIQTEDSRTTTYNIWRGDYDSAETYHKNNVVNTDSDGHAYQCKRNYTQTIHPTDDEDGKYWEIFDREIEDNNSWTTVEFTFTRAFSDPDISDSDKSTLDPNDWDNSYDWQDTPPEPEYVDRVNDMEDSADSIDSAPDPDSDDQRGVFGYYFSPDTKVKLNKFIAEPLTTSGGSIEGAYVALYRDESSDRRTLLRYRELFEDQYEYPLDEPLVLDENEDYWLVIGYAYTDGDGDIGFAKNLDESDFYDEDWMEFFYPFNSDDFHTYRWDAQTPWDLETASSPSEHTTTDSDDNTYHPYVGLDLVDIYKPLWYSNSVQEDDGGATLKEDWSDAKSNLTSEKLPYFGDLINLQADDTGMRYNGTWAEGIYYNGHRNDESDYLDEETSGYIRDIVEFNGKIYTCKQKTLDSDDWVASNWEEFGTQVESLFAKRTFTGELLATNRVSTGKAGLHKEKFYTENTDLFTGNDETIEIEANSTITKEYEFDTPKDTHRITVPFLGSDNDELRFRGVGEENSVTVSNTVNDDTVEAWIESWGPNSLTLKIQNTNSTDNSIYYDDLEVIV